MRNLVAFAFILISVLQSTAQNEEDAMRVSRLDANGTARFMAMGGAMGAMGADLSALNHNPAGLGVYTKSDVSATFGFRFSSVKSLYNDSSNRDYRNSLILPNLGICGAGINKSTKEGHFVRSNFAISLSRLQHYRNNVIVAGNSRGGSMALAYSAAAQGKKPESLDAFYELAPYIYDLIDTVNSSVVYESAIPQGANNLQNLEMIEGGGLSELSIGGGYSFDDKVYAGWAVGISLLNYTRSSVYTETVSKGVNYYTPNSGYAIRNFSQLEELQTKGKGINLKIGVIYRFSESLRAGFAYHTGTAYTMKDNYSSAFGIEYDGLGAFEDSARTGVFRYFLFTPQRFEFSGTILLQKAYAINVDAGVINFGNMKLKSRPDYFTTLNKFIRQNYNKPMLNLKLGFERNVRPVILRAGYAVYANPYGQDIRHAASLGGGIKWDNKYLDVVYSLSMSGNNYYMYNSLYTSAASQRFSASFFLISFGSKI